MLNENPLLSFHVIADDIVKLIVHKRKTGNDKEAELLQNAHQCIELLINRLYEEIHILKLQGLSELTKAKILELELKTIYNELYKRDQAFANEMIVKSHIPTKKQLEQEVIIK
jgi:hypothetical protein